MKKKAFIFVGLIAFLASCTDFLDTQPYNKITGNDTWSSEQLTESFLYSLYSSVLQQNVWMGSYGSVYSPRS